MVLGTHLRKKKTEGNLRFKIDWASLIAGSKFTVFALFYFVFEGNFPSTSPPGGSYLEERLNGGFFVLPLWGAYIWKGSYIGGGGGAYFRNFMVCLSRKSGRQFSLSFEVEK